MKLYQVILGLMLVCMAFSARTSNQTHLSVKNIHEILHRSSLSSGLISLVQMYTQNNSKGEAEDLERLNDAFELLKSTLQGKIDTENSKFDAELAAHNDEVSRLSDIVNTLTASVANYEYQLDGLENQLEAQQLEKSNLQSQLSAFQEQQQQSSDYLVNIQEAYDNTVADYGEAVDLLNQALASLEESRLSATPASLTAFVQTNSMNFQNYALLIEKRMEKIQTKKQFFLKPIAQLFVDLQNLQDDEIPADRIDGAIQALQELINHLQVALVQISSNFQEEFANTQSLIEELGNTITLLINEQIPEQQVEIEETEFNIQELNAIVAPIRSDLRLRENELEEENQSWEMRVEMHNILIPKLEGELQVVIGAQNLIGGGSEPAPEQPIEEEVVVEEVIFEPNAEPEVVAEETLGGDESLPVPEFQEEPVVGGDESSVQQPELLPEPEFQEEPVVGGDESSVQQPELLPEPQFQEEPVVGGDESSVQPGEILPEEGTIVGGEETVAPEQTLEISVEQETVESPLLISDNGQEAVTEGLQNFRAQH